MKETVMMELTWRCGAACAFCYLGETGRLNSRRPEMKEAELKAFMRRFPAGTKFYFSGGEPFLRKDIFGILSFAAERGFTWGVNTNGLALDIPGIKKLMGLKPAYIIFSLHGPAAAHDRLTGVKGAHKKILENIRAAADFKKDGTEVITNCVINPANAALLPAVYLDAARAGADRAVFEHLQFIRKGEAARAGLSPVEVITPELDGLRLDTRSLSASLKKIKALRGAFKTHFELRPDFTAAQLERYYNGAMKPSGSCPGLLSTLNVEPDGRIRTCVLYSAPAGRAKSLDLAAIRKVKRRLVKGGLPQACARCCQRFGIKRIF
ncbi:MAG: radical SAM protein [Elusimicrobiales bacterium]|nr:radical SAM protein [Elusimicrobiales bacterium]